MTVAGQLLDSRGLSSHVTGVSSQRYFSNRFHLMQRCARAWVPRQGFAASRPAPPRADGGPGPNSQPANHQVSPPSQQNGHQNDRVAYQSPLPPPAQSGAVPGQRPSQYLAQPSLPPLQQYAPLPPQPQQYNYQQAPLSMQGSQAPVYPGVAQQSYQSGGYATPGPQYGAAAPQAGGVGGLEQINPGSNYLNSVALLGTVTQAHGQGRNSEAILQVPFSSKNGYQEFPIEAWDEVAPLLTAVNGAQVVVQGRLAQDRRTGGLKVVAYTVKLVNPTLPPARMSSLRPSLNNPSAVTATPPGGAARPRTVSPQEAWRVHYETQTQTLQALAAHFSTTEQKVSDALLSHGFTTRSPLRWRVLAVEAGLENADANGDALTLYDFMEMVQTFKAEMEGLQAGAQPGAAQAGPPVTKDGRLRVRPIREWALLKGESSTHNYVLKTYEAAHGESMLYRVLQLAVVAEATKGMWDYHAEFGPQA